ncbi:MAG: hypothetical protein ACJ0HV_01020 [Candidatus Pseudothioglobus sp.]
MVRITKQGGYICFTVRKQEWEASSLYRKLSTILEDTQAWRKLEHPNERVQSERGRVSCQLCLYQVN